MEQVKYEEMSNIFKALSDSNRIKIVDLLYKNGETCACNLLDEFNISQPTLSHHLKVLSDTGILLQRKEANWIHYRINDEKIIEIKETLEDSKFVDNIYNIQRIDKEIINKTEYIIELNKDDYNYISILAEKSKIALEKINQILKI